MCKTLKGGNGNAPGGQGHPEDILAHHTNIVNHVFQFVRTEANTRAPWKYERLSHRKRRTFKAKDGERAVAGKQTKHVRILTQAAPRRFSSDIRGRYSYQETKFSSKWEENLPRRRKERKGSL